MAQLARVSRVVEDVTEAVARAEKAASRKNSGRGRRPSGWQINQQGGAFKVVAAPLSRWERELARRGLKEETVLACPQLMEDWVRREAARVFVPEKILDDLRIVVEG